MSDEEDNEYVALGSYDALAAYLYKQGGADSVLAYFRHIGGFASEDFEEAIAALEHRGLDEVAKVMQELAGEFPSGRTFNPYHPSDKNNWFHWDRSWFNRRRRVTGEVEASLRQQKLRKMLDVSKIPGNSWH